MEVPKHWRLKQQRYALVGEICPYCDKKIFPPRDICPGPGCGENTFTLPSSTRAERTYYGEKGVIVNEMIRSTRVNIREMLEN